VEGHLSRLVTGPGQKVEPFVPLPLSRLPSRDRILLQVETISRSPLVTTDCHRHHPSSTFGAGAHRHHGRRRRQRRRERCSGGARNIFEPGRTTS
jgi:hypothetical protein